MQVTPWSPRWRWRRWRRYDDARGERRADAVWRSLRRGDAVTTRADYTTLTDVKTSYLVTTGTAQDALIADLIRSVSREIEQITNRKFYPRIETRYYDTPREWFTPLYLDDDLLALTTLTNGNGTAFTAAQYKLYPLNSTPKQNIALLASSSERWRTSTAGDAEGAITALGVWGYHDDYASGWLDIACTLAAAITQVGSTSFTCTTGKVRAGDLLLIDSEYIYASAVSTGATDTVTCVRGVNGSTAATHLISAAVTRWRFEAVYMLATVAVVAYLRLKDNPIGDMLQIDGYTFSTPKDVSKYVQSRLQTLGLVRVGVG